MIHQLCDVSVHCPNVDKSITENTKNNVKTNTGAILTALIPGQARLSKQATRARRVIQRRTSERKTIM